MNKLIKHVKKIDWIFFGILLFSVLAPLVHKIFRSAFVYDIGSNTYELAQSWGYIYLIFETMNLFVVVPTYAFIKKNTSNNLEIKQKTVLAFIFAFFAAIIMILIVIGLSNLISGLFINLNDDYIYTQADVRRYLIIFGTGLSFTLLFNILIAYVVLNNKRLLTFTLITLNMVLIIFIDFLFLSSATNPDRNLYSIGYSTLTGGILLLAITITVLFSSDFKEWFSAVRKPNFKKWFKDYKIYIQTGLWLFLEAATWNLLWVFGVTLWIQTDNQSVAFWTTDALFWGGLLIPTLAASLLIAEGISCEKTAFGRREIVKKGFIINIFIVISWLLIVPIIVYGIYPIIFNGYENEQLQLTQRFSLIALGFFIFQIPSRSLYTYFATTEQGIKVFLGTLFGAGVVWVPSLICYYSGLNIKNFEWVLAIYGLGMFMILSGYYFFWRIETMSWYNPKLSGLWSKLTNYEQNRYIALEE